MQNDKSFPRPLTRTIDELALMNDAALDDIEGICRSYIDRGRSSGAGTKEWEEELCYILREREIREIRAVTHKQWLEEQSDDEMQEFISHPEREWINY